MGRLLGWGCLVGLMLADQAEVGAAEPRWHGASETTEANLGIAPIPVPRLPAGVVIGEEKEAGYSNLVTIVYPTLSAGDVESLPDFAQQYAAMFKFTVLANVKRETEGTGDEFVLDKVGIGFAMTINGKNVVVTKDKANDLGADLGMIGKGVLGGNEDCLDEIIQVARTNRLIVFDAEANMLVGDKHEKRMIRHLLWVSPKSGRLGFLVWQLNPKANDSDGAEPYDIDSPEMQLLPTDAKEIRRIHVSSGGLLSAIPTPDRFALVSIPQGRAIPWNQALRAVAGKRVFTNDELKQLVSGVSQSIASLQVNDSDGQQ